MTCIILLFILTKKEMNFDKSVNMGLYVCVSMCEYLGRNTSGSSLTSANKTLTHKYCIVG